MKTHRTLPRILLVEDDPVSALFLQQALMALPAQVDMAETGARAYARAREKPYDIWMIDAHLPDGSGTDLLRELRGIDALAIALAHTASRDAETAQQLLSAGFREIMVKPLMATEVRSAARRALGLAASVRDEAATEGLPAIWDDAAAERALFGAREHVEALRALFLAELPGTRQRVVLAAQDGNLLHVHAELHRLRASCAFVGAARLALAAERLHEALDSSQCLREFEKAVQSTLVDGAVALIA